MPRTNTTYRRPTNYKPKYGSNKGYTAGRRPRDNYPNLRREIAQMNRSKTNYVDGYYDDTLLHELSAAGDDTWADCETNPRQQTAIYGCLPVPRVGTGFADRDDRKIFIKNIKIRGQIRWRGVNGLTSSGGQGLVRLIIVKDLRTNGVTLNAEDVIGAGQGSDGQAVLSGDGGAINFFTKPEGWSRYKIMKDVTFRPPPQPVFFDGTDGAQQLLATPFKFMIKANCYVNFSGNTGAIASIIDNSFHMLAAKADDTAGDASLSYTARTTFIDS